MLFKIHPNNESHGSLWLNCGTIPVTTLLWVVPLKALYGYEADLGTLLPLSAQEHNLALDFLQEKEQQLASLKHHLAVAQNRIKLQADRHRSDRNFQVGAQVLLKLQPYVQHSVVTRPYPKLAFKYSGPVEVEQKIGSAAYRLALPEGSQIHPMFHVSQLKPFTPNYTLVFKELPTVADLSTQDLSPETILDRRPVKKDTRAIPQVLIK